MISCDVSFVIYPLEVLRTRQRRPTTAYFCHMSVRPSSSHFDFLHNFGIDVQCLVNVCIAMLIAQEPGFARIMVWHHTAFDCLVSQSEIHLMITLCPIPLA